MQRRREEGGRQRKRGKGNICFMFKNILVYFISTKRGRLLII